jgi:enolase-phosphatase E1
LDIEGTTTPVDFVYQVLFPYARGHLREFVEQHFRDPEVRADIARLWTEHNADSAAGHGPPPWRADTAEDAIASAIAYVQWLMDADRKSTGLKSLQGKIWETGYRTGELRGRVYPDVPPALERWHGQGRDIGIFSSGSVQAQRLLFSHSNAGDLTGWIRAYFDMTSGPKTEAQSYRRIAATLERAPQQMLFVSDVVAELDAARQAGMRTTLCVRSPGSPADPGGHPLIHTFDDVFESG